MPDDEFEYCEPPSITVWDYEDLSPDIVGVLLDHNGDQLKVVERPRRSISFKPW
jgi:hypothetical protein